MIRNSNISFSLSTLFIFLGISAIQFHSILFESAGFEGRRFTALIFAGYFSAILSPFVMAWFTRYFQQPFTPLLFLLLTAAVTLPLIPQISSFYILVFLYFSYTFCIWGIFPLYMACGMEVYRKQGQHLYFYVRALGTFGFVLGCALSAISVTDRNLEWLYLGFGISFLLSFLFVLRVPVLKRLATSKITSLPGNEPAIYRLSAWKEIFPFFRDTLFARLLVPICLLACANTMALSIQSNYILHVFNGTRTTVSLSWLVCAACEIPIMVLCVYLLKKRSLALVLFLGVAGTAVRLAGMAFSETIWQLFLVFSLHGFYYACIVTGLGIALDRTGWKHRAALQPMFALLYGGIPNVVGAYLAGFVWDKLTIQAVYTIAFVLSLAACMFFLPLLPALKRRFQ